MTFEKVKELLEKKNREMVGVDDVFFPLSLEKGRPDARYSKDYKYTVRYTASRGIKDVYKTLQDIIDDLGLEEK